MLTIIPEHYNGFEREKEINFNGQVSFDKDYFYQFTRKKRNEKIDCFRIFSDKENHKHGISNSYFIGVDWIVPNKKALYVEPKLNGRSIQTDYLGMLFSALKHPEVGKFTEDLFEIKFDDPYIEIKPEQDLLTPLLVVQYLKLLKEIVRKGLKKSYYKVTRNLNAKVKGKILIGQTIKSNLIKNKRLYTLCSYDEFGLNGLENRLLKKALNFVQRYLPVMKIPHSNEYTTEIFNYINPVFVSISEEVNMNDIKQTKKNIFYSEYAEAIRLAQLILKRFGYNITNTEQKGLIKTPPFWIDMSKLFELYVLGILEDKFPGEVEFQFQANYGQPDFLLTKSKVVVDAKYKIYHKENIKGLVQWKRDFIVTDIRQLSGYGRDEAVLNKLGFKTNDEKENAVIKCLIIYPDQGKKESLWDNDESSIEGFFEFHKRAIKLPEIKINRT